MITQSVVINPSFFSLFGVLICYLSVKSVDAGLQGSKMGSVL